MWFTGSSRSICSIVVSRLGILKIERAPWHRWKIMASIIAKQYLNKYLNIFPRSLRALESIVRKKKRRKEKNPLHSENRYQRYNEQGGSPDLSCEHLRDERSENEEKFVRSSSAGHNCPLRSEIHSRAFLFYWKLVIRHSFRILRKNN